MGGWSVPVVLPGVANVAGNPPGARQGRGETWRHGAVKSQTGRGEVVLEKGQQSPVKPGAEVGAMVQSQFCHNHTQGALTPLTKGPFWGVGVSMGSGA